MIEGRRDIRYLWLIRLILAFCILPLVGHAHAQTTIFPDTEEITIPYGTSYSMQFSATGSGGPYTFAIDTLNGPYSSYYLPGLSMTSGGVLSGIATSTGTFSRVIAAFNTDGVKVATRRYAFVITAPHIVIDPVQLLNGRVGSAYQSTLTASGGIAPYSFTVAAGALPSGIHLANDGSIAGTPTEEGTFHFSVRVTDANGSSATQDYALFVESKDARLLPAAGALPSARAGEPYHVGFVASGGGGGTFLYTLTGHLPEGLYFESSTGSLSGVPAVLGTFSFSVQAVGFYGASATNAYELVVSAGSAVAVTPLILPNAINGVPYRQSFVAVGGVPPYRFELISPSLPPGLQLSQAGALEGTPAVSAETSYQVSVRVTDTVGAIATHTANLRVSVAQIEPAVESITIPYGVSYSMQFSATGSSGPYTFAIDTLNGQYSSYYLPGLSMTSSGVLSGIATGTGTFSRVVAAFNTAGVKVATRRYAFVITAPHILIDTNTLPDGMSFAPYERTLNAMGGIAPYTFLITAGTLPAGVTLSTDGKISGTPTGTGTYSFTITATDAQRFTGNRAYTISIAQRPDPSRDPEVLGLLESQSDAAQRFATAQVGNFDQRMQRMHDSNNTADFENRLSVGIQPSCPMSIGDSSSHRCDLRVASSNASDPVAAGSFIGNNAQTNSDAGAALSIWVAGAIRSGRHDNRNNNSDTEFETDGLSLGIDRRFSNTFAAGVGIGYGRDTSDVGDHGSRNKANAYTLAMYSSYRPSRLFYIDSLLGYQSLDFNLRRHVTSALTVVQARRDGNQWFASVSTGAELGAGDWGVNPYLRAEFAQARLDGYVEHGDPLFALRYAAVDVNTSTGNLGMRLDYRHRSSWGVFSPQLSAELQHDFKSNGLQRLQYANLPNGQIYKTPLGDFDKTRWMLGVGLLFDLDSGWAFKLDYSAVLGSGSNTDRGVQLNADWKF